MTFATPLLAALSPFIPGAGRFRLPSWLDEHSTRARLWRCVEVGARVRLHGRVVVHGPGNIRIGDGVELGGRDLPVELFAGPGAELVLGDGCVLEPGVSLECHRSIVIGRGCKFERLAKVLDSHFHPVGGHRHSTVAPDRVLVCDRVFVGARSIVLPGSHLEDGVTLQPETVVSRRVRAGSVIAGCPARSVAKAATA